MCGGRYAWPFVMLGRAWVGRTWVIKYNVLLTKLIKILKARGTLLHGCLLIQPTSKPATGRLVDWADRLRIGHMDTWANGRPNGRASRNDTRIFGRTARSNRNACFGCVFGHHMISAVSIFPKSK